MKKTQNKQAIRLSLCIMLLLTAEMVLADIDNAFSVLKSTETYSAKQGEKVIVTFSISNNELITPKRVTAYIDPCPVSWTCEEPEFSFAEKNKINDVNLTIKIPKTAIPKKYTLFIKLRSNEAVLRGDDRIVATVVSDKQDTIITYDEYLAKKKEDERRRPLEEPKENNGEGDNGKKTKEQEQPNDKQTAEENETQAESKIILPLDASEIIENAERLESSKQFIDYASILLIILLVFIAAGAYITYKKEK